MARGDVPNESQAERPCSSDTDFIATDARPMLACDGRRLVTDANGAALALLGRSRSDVLGWPLEQLAPDDTRARAAAVLETVVRDRSDRWNSVELSRGRGERVRLEVACRPLRDRRGHLFTLRRGGRDPRAPILSDAEREAFERIAQGKTGAEIAAELFRSTATIERQVVSGLRKLGAKNRAHGIALALRSGELERPAPRGPGWPFDEAAPAALLAQTIGALEDPAVVLDERGDVLIANEAWRAFGRANGRFGVQFEDNYLAVCDHAAAESDDAARAARGLRGVLIARSESFTMEYRYDTPAGSRWYELRAIGYHGGHGAARALVLHRDLTDQRRAENDAHLRASLLDGARTATYGFSFDGNVTAWTRGAQALLGWTAEEAIGRPIWELVLRRSQHPRGEALVEEIRRNGTWSGELELERKDGSTLYAHVQASTIMDVDDTPRGLMAVAVDISEQRQTQRGADDTAGHLAALADTMHEGWIVGDAAGRITRTNAATQKLLGWSAEDLIGRSIDEIACASTPLRSLAPQTDSELPRRVHEECLLSKDGRKVPVQYSASRYSSAEGLEWWTIVFRTAATG